MSEREAMTEPPRVSAWLRRTGRRIGLWRDPAYRRDMFRLVILGLRGMVGVRLGVALVLLGAAGLYLLWQAVDSATGGYDLLARLFGIATLLMAAPMYAAEQKQGTFELLWLATGSRHGLILYKAATLLFGLGLLMVPSVLFVSWFMYGTLPPVQALFFLITNSLFIVALMALVGTYLPQAWAGGLMGAAIVVALYLAMGHAVSVFNPFLNPLQNVGPQTVGGGAFATHVSAAQLAGPNRIVVLIFSWVMLNMAGKRLRRAFRD
ncbi:hypothetical protein KQI84_09850 [bacterium]|nr:hypothetical protein [bacterium]